jgi:hypothetical protein
VLPLECRKNLPLQLDVLPMECDQLAQQGRDRVGRVRGRMAQSGRGHQ